MDIQAIRAFLETNKDQADVQSFIGELSAVSADKVKGFLQTDEGKKALQPEFDKYFGKGLETWKANNLKGLIDEEVKKQNPAKTQVEIDLENLRKEIADKDKAFKKSELTNKALAIAAEKKLGADNSILDRFIGEDEESTLANIGLLEAFAKAQHQAGVESVYKTGGRNPGGGQGNGAGGAGGDSLGKKLAEANKTAVNLETQRDSFFQ